MGCLVTKGTSKGVSLVINEIYQIDILFVSTLMQMTQVSCFTIPQNQFGNPCKQRHDILLSVMAV